LQPVSTPLSSYVIEAALTCYLCPYVTSRKGHLALVSRPRGHPHVAYVVV